VISAAAGVAPRFFRPPVGLRNILMYPVLARLGLTHVSWTRRGLDTVTWRPQGVARRLTRSLRPGDILMMHDGHHRNARSGRAVVLEALPKILDRIDALGLKAVSLAQAAGW
jgi:peptidoglycan/xylan/chitin deacetylase (PgdA/CDA1 family)